MDQNLEQETNVTNDTQKEEVSTESYESSIKNVKAEFNRKIDNITSSQQELIKAIENMTKSASESKATALEGEDIDDLLYTNPKEAAKKIKEEAKYEIKQELSSQAEQTNVLNQLVRDFPELNKEDHDLTKKTLEYYSKLSENDKKSPLSYKVAVHEAAANLGILPKARRKADSGEFSFSNNGVTSKAKPKIAKETMILAELMGLPVDDPKFIDKIAKNTKEMGL